MHAATAADVRDGGGRRDSPGERISCSGCGASSVIPRLSHTPARGANRSPRTRLAGPSYPPVLVPLCVPRTLWRGLTRIPYAVVAQQPVRRYPGIPAASRSRESKPRTRSGTSICGLWLAKPRLTYSSAGKARAVARADDGETSVSRSPRGDEYGVLVVAGLFAHVPVRQDAGVAGEVGGVHHLGFVHEVVEVRWHAGSHGAAQRAAQAPVVVAVAVQERVDEARGVQAEERRGAKEEHGRNRSGANRASCTATAPPKECPTRTGCSMPQSSRKSARLRA